MWIIKILTMLMYNMALHLSSSATQKKINYGIQTITCTLKIMNMNDEKLNLNLNPNTKHKNLDKNTKLKTRS